MPFTPTLEVRQVAGRVRLLLGGLAQYSSRIWLLLHRGWDHMSARLVQLGCWSRKARVTAANSGEVARL
jgi:hypothetical protein